MKPQDWTNVLVLGEVVSFRQNTTTITHSYIKKSFSTHLFHSDTRAPPSPTSAFTQEKCSAAASGKGSAAQTRGDYTAGLYQPLFFMEIIKQHGNCSCTVSSPLKNCQLWFASSLLKKIQGHYKKHYRLHTLHF